MQDWLQSHNLSPVGLVPKPPQKKKKKERREPNREHQSQTSTQRPRHDVPNM